MTQQNLYEFINQRCITLGIGWRALSDAGIGGQTIQNIRNGIPIRIAEITKQKLARALQCSIGDINAVLSQTPQDTPFGERVSKRPEPSVMETVDKLEELVKAEYPEAVETATNPEDSETKVEETGTAPEENATNPEETDDQNGNGFDWVQEKPKRKRKKTAATDIEEPPKKVKIIKAAISENHTDPMTAEEYRQQLKDMCLKNFAKFGSQGHMESAYVSIARNLLTDLLGEEA